MDEHHFDDNHEIENHPPVPPPVPPSSRPRKPARNPVCIVLPKKWEQHAESHTVEQVQRVHQQRPTLYKCLTCQLGFTKVNDLLTHCAQIHAPEPRLEIAIDYNKAADQRQGEALMDFIRVPERSTEMANGYDQNGEYQVYEENENEQNNRPPVPNRQNYGNHHYIEPENGRNSHKLPSAMPRRPNEQHTYTNGKTLKK